MHGFIKAWNEFIIVSTFNDQAEQNLTAWLRQDQTQTRAFWGLLTAGSLTAIPVVTFFLIIQRNIATGLTAVPSRG